MSRRLTELAPKWYGWFGTPSRIGVGFDCPVHGGPDAGRQGHRVFVPFANPLEGKAESRPFLWTRTGRTFETLTLAPSVDYTRYADGSPRDGSCWHGFIVNGDVF